ncbi:hypothetical protein [Gaiella sp.]
MEPRCYRGSKEPDLLEQGDCVFARLVKPLRNVFVVLSSFFLLAVG